MIGTEVQNLSGIFETIFIDRIRSIEDVVRFAGVVAQTDGDESWAFLGEDSLAWLVLAFGAAMVVGNVLALVRPPGGDHGSGAGDTSGRASSGRAPLGRAVVMIVVGALAAVWGLASILR